MLKKKSQSLSLSMLLASAVMISTPAFGATDSFMETGEPEAVHPVVTQEIRRLWVARQDLEVEMKEQQDRADAFSEETNARIDGIARTLERIRTALDAGTADRGSLRKALSGLQSRLEALSVEVERKLEASADRQTAVLEGVGRSLEVRAAEQARRLDEDREALGSLRMHAVLLYVLALTALACGLCAVIMARRLSALQAAGRSEASGIAKRLSALEENLSGLMAENARQLDEIAGIAAERAREGADRSPDQVHDLIRTLADRITFMQTTLSRMDGSIRGHRQLTKSLKQIRDNLQAYGYEIVDMLGQPYNDGIKAVASFIDDEGVPKGQRIITGVTKPQINYNGTMIQSAQITVSQNI